MKLICLPATIMDGTLEHEEFDEIVNKSIGSFSDSTSQLLKMCYEIRMKVFFMKLLLT